MAIMHFETNLCCSGFALALLLPGLAPVKAALVEEDGLFDAEAGFPDEVDGLLDVDGVGCDDGAFLAASRASRFFLKVLILEEMYYRFLQ
jgi:hypothetical protein